MLHKHIFKKQYNHDNEISPLHICFAENSRKHEVRGVYTMGGLMNDSHLMQKIIH
jgi:hypothetical protein